MVLESQEDILCCSCVVCPVHLMSSFATGTTLAGWKMCKVGMGPAAGQPPSLEFRPAICIMRELDFRSAVLLTKPGDNVAHFGPLHSSLFSTAVLRGGGGLLCDVQVSVLPSASITGVCRHTQLVKCPWLLKGTPFLNHDFLGQCRP